MVDDQPRNASTNPESGMRFYSWQDQKLISVTTARRAAGMPFNLHYWSLGQVINGVFENIEAISGRLASKDPADLATLKHDVRAFATAERDSSAKLGTAVHDAASRLLKVEEVPPELRPRLRQYYDWLKTSKARVLASEFQVYNLTDAYGGTVDLLVQMPNDTIWLVDLKTGKGVYPEHVMQTVAYKNTEFSGQHNCGDRSCKDPAHDVVNQDLTELLGLIDGVAILHLADNGWDFIAVKEEGAQEAFLGLLKFAEYTMANPTIDTLVKGRRHGAAPGEAAIDAAPDPEPPQEAAFGLVEAVAEPVDVTEEAKLIFEGEIASIDGIPVLTREEFMERVRFVKMPVSLLSATAHALFPAISDMRLLSDEQRGVLFAAADTAWAATA